MICRPVVVSPVKAILAMRGLDASGAPTSEPCPLTTDPVSDLIQQPGPLRG